ncbi:MAG: HPr family phosphocarrier protein [Treponema sp.]|jgi:phosphocarrier protein|nr:HPr family phosphocarrier protein [Treponema sp.]
MLEQTVNVLNRAGIHARPASILVRAVKDFNCDIRFERGNDVVNAKSIMGVITLGAMYGSEIRVVTDGIDEQQAMDTIIHLFNSKFEDIPETVPTQH